MMKKKLFLIMVLNAGLLFLSNYSQAKLLFQNPLIQVDSQQGIYTPNLSFGFPLNAFQMQAVYNSHDVASTKVTHVDLIFHNYCYFGTRFSPNSQLIFIADNKTVEIGKPVSYNKIGFTRNEVETITYSVTLDQFRYLSNAKALEGHLDQTRFRFNAQKQIPLLKKLSLNLPI